MYLGLFKLESETSFISYLEKNNIKFPYFDATMIM